MQRRQVPMPTTPRAPVPSTAINTRRRPTRRCWRARRGTWTSGARRTVSSATVRLPCVHVTVASPPRCWCVNPSPRNLARTTTGPSGATTRALLDTAQRSTATVTFCTVSPDLSPRGCSDLP